MADWTDLRDVSGLDDMPLEGTIYGASDDLVEVEGAIREEYTLGDPCTRLRLTAPDGDSLDIVLWFDGQAHATAALVEQQRIANLIALGYGPTSPGGDVGGEARRALVERGSADRHQLRSEVAAALGIEVQP